MEIGFRRRECGKRNQRRWFDAAHAKAILEAGADCITLGDHAFDQKEMMTFIESEPRIIRPLNYAKSAPGRGARILATRAGAKSWLPKFWGRFS